MKKINALTILIALLNISTFVQSCKSTKKEDTSEKVASSTDLDALRQALVDGGTIKLKKRIYNIETPLMISNQKDLVLDGAGSTFIMQDKNADVMIVENSKNITLRNFKATHIEPDGPLGCTGNVIQTRNNDGVTIEKCELNGSGIIGVTSYNTKNLVVADNYIYNNSAYGVLFDTDTSIEIKGNKFEDNGESGKDHVVKGLTPGLSKVKPYTEDINEEGLKMSDNSFK